MDLEELARAYWAAPLYDGSDGHPFDEINDVLDLSSDARVSAMLGALALSAPDERKRAYIGTWCLENLETLRGESSPGESVRLLVAAGLDAKDLFRVLSGVYPDLLEVMGAPGILAGTLPTEQIAWLIDPNAPGRRDWL